MADTRNFSTAQINAGLGESSVPIELQSIEDSEDEFSGNYVINGIDELSSSEEESCIRAQAIKWEMAYGFINTWSKTAYTSAVLITKLSQYQPVILGMSALGMGIGVPLGLLFAISEVYAHLVESQHFNHSEQSNQNRVQHRRERSEPTYFQKACAAIHYFSDVAEGASWPLSIAEMLGLDQAPNWARGITYTGISLYSLFGNAQECLNTLTAFAKANERELEANFKLT